MEKSAHVLVVDDDPAVGKVLGALLAQAGVACEHVPGAAEAIAALHARPVEVVITDLRMPGKDGVRLLEEIVDLWPEIPVILLTAHGTIEVAVEAMKKGAADFLLKPFDREEILFTVRKHIAAAHHADRPPAGDVKAAPFHSASPAMRELHDMIRRAAMGNVTVLIRGESGTGKELAARLIHDSGPRKGAPFVKVHCAALPDTLIESELFGYEKGAFTGAASRKPGRVELAEGGTLFLDEIGDVAPMVQVKLLRLVQDREFERLGGTQSLRTNVRFVAATHQPLEELIKQRLFREDLFYRLNVLPILIPPLRERPDDIESLAAHFSRTFGAANGRDGLEMSPPGLALLREQPWPGNVRQLQNFVERLVVLSDGDTLTAGDVQRELRRQAVMSGITPAASAATLNPPEMDAATDEDADSPSTLDAKRRGAEREALVAALEKTRNNRSQAARVLGISRRTLYHKLEEHGLV